MKTPFTTDQFFEVFRNYNSAVFPFQIAVIALTVIILLSVHGKNGFKNKLITGSLGFLWLWAGIVYHIGFFTAINKAAFVFGSLFIIQGLFFIYELFKNRMVYGFHGKIWDYVGYSFAWFGLIVYPVISYLDHGTFATVISLGLPCPTTILTFGFFMLTDRRIPAHLFIIPVIWALIGTGAAVSFKVYQDYVMLASAVVAVIFLMGHWKENKRSYLQTT